jgi:uracil-DNA glycosylase family protein
VAARSPRVAAVDPLAYREAVAHGDQTLADAATAARHCRACDLWERATQTVFGSGPSTARVMLLGEQPGDKEDRAGAPFVGPAGQLLDRALVAARIDRRTVYVTNVVKHFSWEERGKWRIHKKPKPHQIRACRPWLETELAALRPQVLVCLGATAAQAVLGRTFRVSRQRGEFIASPLAPYVMATVHPSALLRAPDDETRHAEIGRFVADLSKIAAVLAAPGRRRPRRGTPAAPG